jgi:hypothetical protein
MTHTPSTSQPRQRSSPTWLNAIIVAVVTLVGVWAVWEFAIKKPEENFKAEEVTSVESARPARRGAATGSGNNPPAVRGGRGGFSNPLNALTGGNRPAQRDASRDQAVRIKTSGGNSTVTARWGDVILSATFADSRGASTLSNIDFDYTAEVRDSWVTSDQAALHLQAWRVTNTSNLAAAAKLTDDQRQKLELLTYRPFLSVDELTRLRLLLTGWAVANNSSSAERTQATDMLLAAMTQIGQAHVADTKAAYLKRIAAIPTILSAEQIKIIKGY